MTLLHLMLTFFYVGLFTIGGGLVAITLMYGPIVEGGLISSEQFYNMVAISESTPGPIGINMATYIGYQLYGGRRNRHHSGHGAPLPHHHHAHCPILQSVPGEAPGKGRLHGTAARHQRYGAGGDRAGLCHRHTEHSCLP